MTPVLSHVQITPVVDAWRTGKDQAMCSLDLGISKVQVVLRDDGIEFPGGRVMTWAEAKKIVKEDRKCFLLDEDGLKDVRAYSQVTGWVRSLCPTAGAPTMLVSGIPMHRIKNTDPMADTQSKIKALGEVRGSVLDTATGLGYTAIEAARTATEVVSVELDPAAVQIARCNPWSARLFDSARITQVIGDVFQEIQSFPARRFSGVIHDPPTIQFAGELYSLEFYRQMHRVLARNGRLFHYVGDPKSAHGSKVTQGVLRRLSDAGFRKIERRPEAFGLTAVA